MSQNSMVLNAQWSSRPMDERFLTIEALHERVKARRVSSSVMDVALDSMQVQPTDGGEIALLDRDGEGGALSHFAFSQLCQRAGAPAGYLRTLPASLAVMPLQWSLETHEAGSDEGNDAKLLARTNGHRTIAAVTSPTYGRIWDDDVVSAIRARVDLTQWVVPAASYSKTDPKRATTLYASDRDVFVFLVNEEHKIEAKGESLNRGFYVYNSEVGSATFGLATFLYDRICDNRIIWGQKDFRELKIRHTSGGPHRFITQAAPQLKAYLDSSTAGIASTIQAAKAREIGKDQKSVVEWMRARGFTAPQAKAAYTAAEKDPRGYNPRSIWGLVQGATDAAHEIGNADARTDIERKAGDLLDIVADAA